MVHVSGMGGAGPGYTVEVTDPRLEDHATGLELQMIELVEQRERAVTQGRTQDAEQLQREIDQLQQELVATVDQLAEPAPRASELARPD